MGCADEVSGPLTPGTWGGVGVHLEVTSTGAEAEFDCATGAIPTPIRLDADGRYSVAGTFTLEHGGPVREDEEPDVRDAVYRGRLRGGVLALAIDVVGLGETGPITYELRFGDAGRLRKCL